MTIKSALFSILQHEGVSFVLTNRIPRALVTRFIGWFAKIEQPVVRDASLRIWQMFTELELEDAVKTEFKSVHDCFIRELKPGARPIATDPGLLVSPCDGIVVGSGEISGTELIQAKGLSYTLEELLVDPELVSQYRDGRYVTLRLTSAMYHRFHAPHDCHVEQVTYISGDTWNTNPIALKRIERLYCKNERAVLRMSLTESGHVVTLVPVASILVASIRLHFVDVLLHLRHRGPNVIACRAPFRKGQEMGWFQHGSTIIVLAPGALSLCPSVKLGATLRVGQPLLRLP